MDREIKTPLHPITKGDLDEFREWFLDDPDFVHSVGTANIAKFAAIFDLAEKSVIREADSDT